MLDFNSVSWTIELSPYGVMLILSLFPLKYIVRKNQKKKKKKEKRKKKKKHTKKTNKKTNKQKTKKQKQKHKITNKQKQTTTTDDIPAILFWFWSFSLYILYRTTVSIYVIFR